MKVLLVLLAACAPIQPAAPDASIPPATSARVTELRIVAQYVEYSEGGIHAATTSCGVPDVIYLELSELDTTTPHMMGVSCDPLHADPATWSIQCQEYAWCDTCLPWYWVYYDFYLDRLGWDDDERQWHGWVYISIDIGEYFWCVMTFRAVEISETSQA